MLSLVQVFNLVSGFGFLGSEAKPRDATPAQAGPSGGYQGVAGEKRGLERRKNPNHGAGRGGAPAGSYQKMNDGGRFMGQGFNAQSSHFIAVAKGNP
jgi:hypothetical protein